MKKPKKIATAKQIKEALIVDLMIEMDIRSEYCEMDELWMKENKRLIDELCNRLQMDTIQVIVLSHLFMRGESLTEIADHLGVSWLYITGFRSKILELVDRRYLHKVDERGNFRNEHFEMTRMAIRALDNNTPLDFVMPDNMTPEGLAKEVFAIFNDARWNLGDRDRIDNTWNEVHEFMEANRHVKFAGFLVSDEDKEINIEEKLLLALMASKMIIHHQLYFSEEMLASYLRYDADVYIPSEHVVVRSLEQKKMIEYSCARGLSATDMFTFTKPVMEQMMSDVYLGEQLTISARRCIREADTIVEMEMFYNQKEQEQMERLQNLLEPERMKKVQEMLEKEGLRTGFTCLFYGAPGTGKTESVLQLARKSGRGVVEVDVAEIKSKWVGESEEKMRELFGMYDDMVSRMENPPILFLNEADAVIGIRKENAEDAVDKMENSIQNIILEEMEKMRGVMIATTNLLANFDRAFERRFLYKIEFKKPEKEAMAKIWKSKMKNLITEEEAMTLAERYPLSGGQIENICRKARVEMVLDGRDHVEFTEIATLCGEETINLKRSIGF